MFALVLMLLAISFYLVPLGLIAKSRRTRGHEKTIWLMTTLVFSWISLLLYYTVVPTLEQRKQKQHRQQKSGRPRASF